LTDRLDLTVQVDPDLQFLLRPARRHTPLRLHPSVTDTIGHVVQAVGIPLTEVGALALNGERVEPSTPAAPGTLTVAPVIRPQRTPTTPPRFLADVHLGKLARRMRLLGLDVAWPADPDGADDDALVARAAAEGRVLLTRDRLLLHRRALPSGALVRGQAVTDQLDDVLSRFRPPLAPWTRCVACGGALRPAPREEVADQLEPGTLRTYEDFSRCVSCGRAYWRGAHARRLEAVIEDVRRA
jgi:uncharacterized protein with PIN domain